NELSLVFDKIGINIWEVIDAASTKPLGFMPHYPGIGVGGHCIPVDPYYMAYKARKTGHMTRFIELAGEINRYMPIHTTYLAVDALSAAGVALEKATVTVLGVSYKPNTSDCRDSPSLDIIRNLKELVSDVRFYDPYVKETTADNKKVKSLKSLEHALECDCVVLAVPHDEFLNSNLEEKIANSCVKAVVDGKNLIKRGLIPGIVYKGIGGGDGK
ncbi:MAG: nucleotide sugar dehydrogenase, partial [Candidatus Methanofastidiosia archaeon]